MSDVKVKWPVIAKEWDKTYFNYIDLGNYTMFRMSFQVADFLNAQLNKDSEQQGHYYDQVIKDVEPYGAIGEGKYMPWSPEIL